MEPLNEYFAWNLRYLGPMEEALLSDAELSELFDLMADDDLPDAAMTMEQADGFLTALVVGPEPLPVHVWMEDIFGQPTLPLPQDEPRQQRLLHLLRARYLDIQLRLAMSGSAITQDTVYTPLRAELPEGECITPYQLDEKGLRKGNWVLKEWADGFRLAMSGDERWDDLIEDPEAYGLVGAVMLFHLGYNPDRPEVQVDQDEELQTTLIQAMYAMRQWWRDYHRHSLPPSLPYERETPKVGRNDPCPCGSGKKYKKCCGA